MAARATTSPRMGRGEVPPPLTPIERKVLDDSVIEEVTAHLDAVVPQAHHALGVIVVGANRVEAGRPEARLERDAIID